MEKVITILLAEDDQVDVIDIKRSLDKLNLIYRLVVARNGEEAIWILEGKSSEGPIPVPDIILLDINMPRMNGLELLQVIRSREEWKDIKCFVITTSDEGVDKEAARKLGVSGYIIKPFKIKNSASIDSFNLMIDLMNMKQP